MGGWDEVGLGRQVDSGQTTRRSTGAVGGRRVDNLATGLDTELPVGCSDRVGGIFFPFASFSCELLGAEPSVRVCPPCPSEGGHTAGPDESRAVWEPRRRWEWGVLCLWPEKRGFVGSFLKCVEGEHLPPYPPAPDSVEVHP